MTIDQAFRRQQRQVAIRMGAAVIVTVAAIGGSMSVAGGTPQPFAGRLVTALAASLFVAFWLLAAIANVARLRFFSPEDIAGSGGTTASEAVRHAAAVLENTLEQVVLAVPVYLGLAAILKRPLPLLVALAGLFSLGRVLFWLGYPKGAPARAFGFALTFYPSAFSLLIAVFVLLSGKLG